MTSCPWYFKMILGAALAAEIWGLARVELHAWATLGVHVGRLVSDPQLLVALVWIALGGGGILVLAIVVRAIAVCRNGGRREIRLAEQALASGDPSSSTLSEHLFALRAPDSESAVDQLARAAVPPLPELWCSLATLLPRVGMIGTLVGLTLLSAPMHGDRQAALYGALATAVYTSIVGLTASVAAEAASSSVQARYRRVRRILMAARDKMTNGAVSDRDGPSVN